MAILIVDDGDLNRRLLHLLLERLGHEVVEARDGLDALEQLETHPAIDAAIIDIMMPRMNGWRLIAAMRERAEWRGMPILPCTAVADREALQQALAHGLRHYLVKPVTRERVSRAVAQALEQAPGRLQPVGEAMQRTALSAERYAERVRTLAADIEAYRADGPDAAARAAALQRIVEGCKTLGAERTRAVVGRARNATGGRDPSQMAAILDEELRLLETATRERLTELTQAGAAVPGPACSAGPSTPAGADD